MKLQTGSRNVQMVIFMLNDEHICLSSMESGEVTVGLGNPEIDIRQSGRQSSLFPF